MTALLWPLTMLETRLPSGGICSVYFRAELTPFISLPSIRMASADPRANEPFITTYSFQANPIAAAAVLKLADTLIADFVTDDHVVFIRPRIADDEKI